MITKLVLDIHGEICQFKSSLQTLLQFLTLVPEPWKTGVSSLTGGSSNLGNAILGKNLCQALKIALKFLGELALKMPFQFQGNLVAVL